MVNKDKVRNEGMRKYFEKPSNKKANSDPSPPVTQQGADLEEVTEQTSSLDISGATSKKRRSGRKQNSLPERLLSDDVRRSPRLLKRARSTVDEVGCWYHLSIHTIVYHTKLVILLHWNPS